MKGFVQDIEALAVNNEAFRRVLYTAKNCQLVLMTLKPKEEIGAEVHTLDQFFRVEEGSGEAVLDGVATAIQAGFAEIIPAGANHRDGVIHQTWEDAESDDEHFDGVTTESMIR
ncbi:MAG: cupin domain-containing protein [Bdellovibrionales bacterium]|nr:cupin domain-containing protein [Bdellovibrionales bacterium]